MRVGWFADSFSRDRGCGGDSEATDEALASEFDRLGKEREQLLTDISESEARLATKPATTPDKAVEGALALLDDLTHIITTPAARAEINPLLQRLGIWIGLTFGTEVKGKKREVQKLLSGRMTFGDGPLPVPLFEPDHIAGGPHGCANDGHQVDDRGAMPNDEAPPQTDEACFGV